MLRIKEIVEYGRFCKLSLGSIRDDVSSVLGEPDDVGKLKNDIEILRYGDLQIVLKDSRIIQFVVQVQDLTPLCWDDIVDDDMIARPSKNDLTSYLDANGYRWTRSSQYSFSNQEAVATGNGVLFIFDYGIGMSSKK